MKNNTVNEQLIYVLESTVDYEGSTVLGVFTDLAVMKEAIIMEAERIRDKLQYVPAYHPCEASILDDAEYAATCDKQCEGCDYYVAPERYERELEMRLRWLHSPIENICVSVMRLNTLPEKTVEDDWEWVSVDPVIYETYRLFHQEPLDSCLQPKYHYISELYGEEIFDLFAGSLSDLERERNAK